MRPWRPTKDPSSAPQHRRRLTRGLGYFVVGLLAAVIAHDAVSRPSEQWLNRAALRAINSYQATLSPWMPSAGVNCRFTPTCSHYGEAALRVQGIFRGSATATWRILRCGPWSPIGTHDPPPQRAASASR